MMARVSTRWWIAPVLGIAALTWVWMSGDDVAPHQPAAAARPTPTETPVAMPAESAPSPEPGAAPQRAVVAAQKPPSADPTPPLTGQQAAQAELERLRVVVDFDPKLPTRLERNLRADVEWAHALLAALRREGDPSQPDYHRREAQMVLDTLEAEHRLAAFLRGDWYAHPADEPAPDLRGTPFRTERYVFQSFRHGLTLLWHRDDANPLIEHLRREVAYRDKISAFNALPESMRRIALRERAKVLVNPNADRSKLLHRFPPGCLVDEVTATIR